MSRLVVVSNRVADLKSGTQSGGLAVAIFDALRKDGGLWFGWSGEVSPRPVRATPDLHTEGNIATAKIPLSKRDYEEFYLGFSNSVLWPILHYRLDLAEFEGAYLDGYRRVNATFARALMPLLEPGDIIWVQDYHLFPLAAELRAAGAKQRMGFFLHIPFPPPDILIAMPEHEWIVRSLFAYDVVGFQTQADVTNLRRYVLSESGGTIGDDMRLEAYGARIQAAAFPIGIDVDSIVRMATTDYAQAQIDNLQRRATARSHIIGVDRLDYSKGLPERFRAFRRLLELYPENQKRATLMQIAAPTREDVEAYGDIRRELESLSGSINGEFADFDWTPLRYIHRSVPRTVLAALFRGSQVGLVTPLRDGMNLVAKEYIAAQDEADPGVLVLSRFAGAAEELEEALIINPYDTEDLVEAMQKAITMPLAERQERQIALMERIRKHDAKFWRESFREVLAAVPVEEGSGGQ